MVAVGGGTLLFMAVRIMEDVPLLVPKVVVSTMVVNSLGVFGNHKDIVYLQSPCDFGALNPLSEAIIANAANIVTAMTPGLLRTDGRAVAITAIGITGVYTEPVKAFWRGRKGWPSCLSIPRVRAPWRWRSWPPGASFMASSTSRSTTWWIISPGGHMGTSTKSGLPPIFPGIYPRYCPQGRLTRSPACRETGVCLRA